MALDPLKNDPTRLNGTRRSFLAEIRRRLLTLKESVVSLVLSRDVFGLEEKGLGALGTSSNGTPKGEWKSLSPADKVEAFLSWWEEESDRVLVSPDWYSRFLFQAYSKGLQRSFLDFFKFSPLETHDWQFAYAQFVRGLDKSHSEAITLNIRKPKVIRDVGGRFLSRRVKEISVRLKQDIKGLTTATAQRMGRVLDKAFQEGWKPKQLAKSLINVVDTLSKARANTIAQTELTKAHALAQLDAWEELGETEVGVRAEWHAQPSACKLCEPMDGVILTIEEARGLIPRHPGCKCSWELASTSKKRAGQITAKREKQRAINRSKREGPKDDSWSPEINTKPIPEKEPIWEPIPEAIPIKKPIETIDSELLNFSRLLNLKG